MRIGMSIRTSRGRCRSINTSISMRTSKSIHMSSSRSAARLDIRDAQTARELAAEVVDVGGLALLGGHFALAQPRVDLTRDHVLELGSDEGVDVTDGDALRRLGSVSMGVSIGMSIIISRYRRRQCPA